MNYGICTNLPSQCAKAASRELIAMPTPDTPCPECRSRLQPHRAAGGFRLSGPVIGMGVLALMAVAAGVFLLTTLGGRKDAGHGATAGFIAPAGPADGGETLLRLSGSNTIGSDLGPKLAEAWLTSKGAADIKDTQRTGPDGAPIPERLITATLNGKAVRIEVRAHGSADAFTDLAKGAADVGMASRPIKDEEAAALAVLGDMRGRASEHVLGLDGVAVIVPQSNTVPKLSKAQLMALFSGQIADWSAVGGPPGPVRLHARDDKSGTFDTFKSLVLHGADLGAARRYDDSARLEADVAADPGGVGFVGMPYVKTTRAVPISDGPAAALEPTVFTVKTESYPLSRRLFLYTPAQPAKAAVTEFVEFALSAAGQQVVKAAGFVDLDLRQAAAPLAAASARDCQLSALWKGDRQDYCRLRAGAEQLPTAFRFLVGSAELDTRAARDLRRVLEALESRPGGTIVLAGFADSSGARAANCALSKARAQRVADALATLGLMAGEVRGYCDELPVRDNADADGREQNRRVEIFIR